MKSYFVKRVFEIAVVVLGMILTGWYLASTTDVNTLIVRNEVSVQNEKSVQITLKGEVKNPGTYTVPAGTFLYDAVRMAGGTTDKADLSKFDLSLPLVCDTAEYIPGKADGVYVNKAVTESGDALLPDVMCNINTASESELCELPGIGDTLAGRIILYREQNGNFMKTKDIKNVKGIGDKLYSKIKDCITVGEP